MLPRLALHDSQLKVILLCLRLKRTQSTLNEGKETRTAGTLMQQMKSFESRFKLQVYAVIGKILYFHSLMKSLAVLNCIIISSGWLLWEDVGSQCSRL